MTDPSLFVRFSAVSLRRMVLAKNVIGSGIGGSGEPAGRPPFSQSVGRPARLPRFGPVHPTLAYPPDSPRLDQFAQPRPGSPEFALSGQSLTPGRSKLTLRGRSVTAFGRPANRFDTVLLPKNSDLNGKQ